MTQKELDKYIDIIGEAIKGLVEEIKTNRKMILTLDKELQEYRRENE